MAVEVIMPQMGLTMTQGEIIQWLKPEGSVVVKDEPIAEIQSDKATFELEAPADGTIVKVLYGQGETVPIGTVIAFIGAQGEKVDAVLSQQPESEQPKVEQERKNENHTVLPQLEEERQRLFISPRAKRAALQKGLTEQELRKISGTGPNGRIIEKNILDYQPQAQVKVKVTPLASKVAAAHNIDLAGIQGSDLGGKITQKDVLQQIKDVNNWQTAAPLPVSGVKVEKIIPVDGIRKIIAERMSYSVHTAPHVTLTTEIDMTEMLVLRSQLNTKALNGEKISVTDLIVKVVALALEKHPMVNATFEDGQIKLWADVNIGIAVATEKGLIVPNIKETNRKSLLQVSREAKDLITRAREGKLKPDEMTGGTFTVTNLGMFDIDAFTPIINQPESAILGVGRMLEKPVVRDGQIVIRTMMALSLSFDHRVLDGAPAAEFLKTIKLLLENPLRLLLGV